LFSINHISLIQFRNYDQKFFDLNHRVIAVCGLNGSGKTNLLDAIHYLCFTKSYFNKPDSHSSTAGLEGFNITGQFQKNDSLTSVSVLYRESGKKELLVDKELVTPFSAHIGKFPLVFIAPDDIILITGSSEERRKMMDTILSQTDDQYLSHLIRYNKCLQDRNKYLKSLENMSADHVLLDSFDENLYSYGKLILEKRIKFLSAFLSMVSDLYAFISSESDLPILQPVFSTMPASYLEDLKRNRQKDLILQRTSVGIHKDDIDLQLMQLPFKQMASQGQKKSLLFAFKLAEFEYMKNHFQFPPILLLDDIFEKLDQERLGKLLQRVGKENTGQVILTDTHESRVRKSLEDISLPFHMINTSENA
jgi:DNA replication and repair protein RecF